MLSRVEEIGVAAESAARAARAGARQLRRADFTVLRPLAADVLREQAGLVAGAGVVLAPAVAADAPRCIEWWWADAAARISRLRVDTDPGSAECYDYTTTEWYREPERTGRAAVAGPYVNFICTREYTFTLAVPVHDAGRFLGVAGADILAGHVERLVLPGLRRPGPGGRAGQRRRPGHRVEQRQHPARHRAARPAAAGRAGPGGRAGRAAAVDPAQLILSMSLATPGSGLFRARPEGGHRP